MFVPEEEEKRWLDFRCSRRAFGCGFSLGNGALGAAFFSRTRSQGSSLTLSRGSAGFAVAEGDIHIVYLVGIEVADTCGGDDRDREEIARVLQEWLEKKVPVLPLHPTEMKLGGSNCSIRRVLEQFDRPVRSGSGFLSVKVSAPLKKGISEWDYRIRSFLVFNWIPWSASTSYGGGLAALTGYESGVENKKGTFQEETCHAYGTPGHSRVTCLDGYFEQQGVYRLVLLRAMDHYPSLGGYFEQQGVYRLVLLRAMDHYPPSGHFRMQCLGGYFEQQGVYRMVLLRAMDHYLSSPSSVADLGLGEHGHHVPDEVVCARDSQGSEGECRIVNCRLISHAVMDRVSTLVGDTLEQETWRKATGEACGSGLQPRESFWILCFQFLLVLGMVYMEVQAGLAQAFGAWNELHRSVGDSQFYIHREIGLGKVIRGELISSDGGVGHIRWTLQSGQLECVMCFGNWQMQRGIVISQKQVELLVAFAVQDCKTSSSPMAVSRKLSALVELDASGYRKLGRSLDLLGMCLPVGLFRVYESAPKTHLQTGL